MEDRYFLQTTLARSPSSAFRRSALAWVLACLGLSRARVFPAGFSSDDALLLSLALPVSALAQAQGLDVLLKRILPFFYFDSDYARNLGAWLPDLVTRLRRYLAAPLGILAPPLLAAFIVAQPLSLASLLWLGAWAGAAVLAGAWALQSLVAEPVQDLQQALGRFGRGDLQALLDVTSGDELGSATEAYNKSVRAVDRRFFVLENFGHAVGPGRAEALFDGGLRLDGELRRVAVLECAWHNIEAVTRTLEPAARLSTLNRFYEAFQDAVDKSHGAVLELGGGRVLACWGAPLAEAEPVQGALTAAWSLQAHLRVWANQQRLRGGTSVEWGLGLASGEATVGLLGPKGRQRYAVLGGPVSEVRGLASKPSGPWLDERIAAAAQIPFAVQISSEGVQLIAGPEQIPPAPGALGFNPGERL